MDGLRFIGVLKKSFPRSPLTQVDQLKQVLLPLRKVQEGEGDLLIAAGVLPEIVFPDIGHQFLPQGFHIFKFRINRLGGAA